jgi:hypothetical protein
METELNTRRIAGFQRSPSAGWDPNRPQVQSGFEFLDPKAPAAAEVTAAVFGFQQEPISDPKVSCE